MAKIPLRAYVKDIENLIERGEIEQAVSHAKNILKSYPKHIDTYRLLGKAFLESQRYSEAADILQRVLSALPDDFISQIGMSIIREDEGNLDASIWHMERAYEVQPFNPAVQDELRRLYGRRDGTEPPKIRLTRGALVRMYARGELYPQAIAETRAALAEDPQRLDLLVLLARLYYLSDHKNDAAEVCSELIRKLPYCYEANRLLAEFLPSTNRAEEAQKFLQRIFALDPYAAFVSPTAPTSDQVPDQAVTVEQFTWDAAMEEANPPEWTRTVGVEWEETKEEALPDWLNTLKPEQSHTGSLSMPPSSPPVKKEEEKPAPEETSYASETNSAELSQEETFPDWMKEAGWVPSDRKADEIMAEQLEPENEDIPPAVLPDWVQSMAPRDASQANEEAERTDWLDTILSQPGGNNGIEAGATHPVTDEAPDLNNLPDWISEAGTGTQAPPPSTTTTPIDLPDWFTQMEDEKAPGTPAKDEAKPVEFEGLPDWSQLGEPSTTEPSSSQGDTPDWLRSFEPQTPEISSSGEQTPNWLDSFSSEATEEPKATTGFTDWLKSERGEEPASEEASFGETSEMAEALAGPENLAGDEPSTVTPAEMLPDWLQAEEPGVVESFAAETTAPQADPSEKASEPPAGASAPSAAAPDFSDMDAAMAWLESLAAKQGADEATLITPAEQRTEKPPEWVTKEAKNETPTPTEAAALPEIESSNATVEPELSFAAAEEDLEWLKQDEPAESTPTVPSEVPAPGEAQPAAPDFSDMDAAMVWLESLAAKQGADEATLVTPPDQHTEKPPEWVTKEAEAQEQIQAEEPAIELPDLQEEPTQPAEANASLPDWLQATEQQMREETETEAPLPETSVPVQAETAMPDMNDMDATMAWLESLAAKQGADEATLVTPPDQRTEKPPEWVSREAETSPAAVQPEPSFAAPEDLDWLKQDETMAPEPVESAPIAQSEAPINEAAQPAAPDFSDMDAAMAWLESLAAKQGADEATLVTPPDQRLENPPEWVTKEAESEPPAPVEGVKSVVLPEAEPSPVEEAVLPDWLQEIAQEETAEIPLAEGEPAAEAKEKLVEKQAEPTNETDLDSAFAWLESLAAKQGADEATLVNAPGDRMETPPEWVQQDQTAEAEAVAGEASYSVEALKTPAEEETISAQPAIEAEMPEWLQNIHGEPGEKADTEEEPVEEIPAWLANIGQEELAQAPAAEETTPWDETVTARPDEVQQFAVDQPVSNAEPLDWIEEAAAAQAGETTRSEETPSPTESQTVPNWLVGMEEEAGPVTVEPKARPLPAEFHSAWEPEVEYRQSVQEQPSAANQTLVDVQKALNRGRLDQAMDGYNAFIQNGQHLEETIHDLRDALYRYPVDINIWQTLGDAYARNNQLQEALDAYTKAEELLR
jgi:tetratricopeptide (TPR) repeat protein